MDEDTAAGDFDFAKTEALPDDAYTPGLDDATGELPALSPGSTDMDLDLDDLTAALKLSSSRRYGESGARRRNRRTAAARGTKQ